MAVYKRYKGKRVRRGDENYDRSTWIAEGAVDGIRYHQSLKNVKTKAKADEQEDFIIAKIRQGEFDLLKDNTKFSDFVDDTYLPYCQLSNANYKQKVYETNTLKRFFGSMMLKAITSSRIEEFKKRRIQEKVRCQKCLNQKHEEGEVCEPRTVSNTFVNRELSTLRKLFNVAIYNRKIKENPMRFVQLLSEPPPRERFLSLEEKIDLFTFLSNKDNKVLLAIVLLALTTGWRKGQILTVKKSALDYKNKAVSIIKSKKNPPRKVPVSDFAWQVFMYLASEAKTDWLFYNEKTKKRLGDFKRSWWTILDKAGIKDFRFHDLRHTFATELLEIGAREFEIQTALGHSEIKTTRGYTHVKNENLRRNLEQLGNNQSLDLPTIFTPSEKTMKKDL